MFNLGPPEMIVLVILGLLVLGSEKLPGFVKTVMRTVQGVRSAVDEVQTEVQTALLDESAKPVKKPGAEKPETIESPEDSA
jgi:Sec-independent protein translocase protein TatA